jgi:hypothetical protein
VSSHSIVIDLNECIDSQEVCEQLSRQQRFVAMLPILCFNSSIYYFAAYILRVHGKMTTVSQFSMIAIDLAMVDLSIGLFTALSMAHSTASMTR